MLPIEQTIAEFVRNAPFATVGPEDRVAVALAAMLEKKVDSVLVTEDGRPIGIFTEHDFLTRVAAERRDPAETPMREVMTPEPETLHAQDRMNYAINRMAVGGYRNIPIVDAEGRATSVLDVRMVMLHLLKLFAQFEKQDGPGKAEEAWTDIGGDG